ncbi:MAG: MtrB/PioB family outer membrane beta-barrel protein, partial [Desulfobulbaceae bacterium]|nr:MtrB/PioB family outer membrane beta-barrel protein [Desulfobulbaceae bacterium]
FMIESGYRNEKTTAVLTAGYSDFDNDDDLLTVDDPFSPQEYSTAADNYSYNLGGRLVQRLPSKSVLALKASYTRNISEADWDEYTTITSPSADDDFDGDIEYIRGSAALTSRWSAMLDTRLFYNYVDRNNDSEEITTIDGGTNSNQLFEYDKHEAGLDANFRLNKMNKLTSGYEFSYVNRNGREDADKTTDNLIFAQLKNTSLDWMSTKIRLEYLNRSSDTDYDTAYLAEDHQNPFFTPFDYASKDRYKGKVAFDFYPTESLVLGLSYALVYDDYDATQLGMQDEQRHEIYVDVNALLPGKIRLNTFAGYEYTKSNFDSRNYFGSSSEDPTAPDTSGEYNWSQETTYDFVVIGSSLTVPVIPPLDLVFSADHQLVDGNIDFSRPAIAGAPLEDITNADDYYKTQLGAKGIYRVGDAWTVTLGYLYEKSNLDEWKYTNYELETGSFNLSGAGLDSDYETHQFYMTTTFRF